MSWLDKVKDRIKITTGDGEKFSPDWINASFQIEYRYTEFNFVDVPGALVKKKKAIGTKYNLELYFQGADHLTTAEKFRKSCDASEAPWIIEHPFYSIIHVQPTVLNFDNKDLSVTKVSGTVIETMEEPPINNVFEPMDQIPAMLPQNKELADISVDQQLQPADINTITNSATQAYKKGAPIISNVLDAELFTNAYNETLALINSATATPLLLMNKLTTLLQLPAKFIEQVKHRINTLINTFNALRNTLFGTNTVSAKQIYTAQQCAIVAALCEAAVSPRAAEYNRASTVFGVIEQITEVYAQLVEDLDGLQTENANSPQSFVANAELLISLNQIVTLTVTSLFTVALGAKTERSIICEKNTNLIELTHRLYGLDSSDANMKELEELNELAVWEYLQIEKDRKIIYYV